LVFLVLMLAVLNPWACVLHCLVREAAMQPSTPRFTYICHTPSRTPAAPSSASPASSLAPAQPGGPQAVYACVLLALVLIPGLLVANVHFATTGSSAHHTYHPPLVPPPRSL
jgi:hypothetical protein